MHNSMDQKGVGTLRIRIPRIKVLEKYRHLDRECRAMGCTIQWIKGGGYPKNLNTETESLGEVQGYGILRN